MKKKLQGLEGSKVFFVILLLFVIFFSLGTNIPNEHRRGFFSDESSYFSITQSLAYDLDIKYRKEDISRIEERFPAGPAGLYLKRGKDGEITFAKPFIYPIFAAPFFRLLDTNGILLFNGLMLFFSILMGFLLLRQHHPEKQSLLLILVFVFASVCWIYTWWLTSDLFNFFTLFSALFFFFYKFKRASWFYLAGFFFAAFIMSKPTNLAAVGVIFLILLYRKEWKRFILLSLVCLIFLGGFVFFYYLQTGEVSYKLYYGGERTAFYGRFPYERPEFKFNAQVKTTADDYWKRIHINPEIAALNLFYYIFGRFTGMFIYFFPAFFLFIIFFMQRKTPEDWFILAAILLSIVIACVLFAADSYFGGSGSLGNRYFMNIFPLFFFLGFKNRLPRFSLVPVLAAAILLAPTFMDALFYSYRPRMAGVSFPINYFPVEKTQYPHIPTNENPHGRNRDIGGKYRLFFINDNFHALEDEQFWTVGEKELEMLLLAPGKVKKFSIFLYNNPVKNRVYLRVEHRKKRLGIGPAMTKRLDFEKIRGLKVAGGYLYHIGVKADHAYCPFFAEENNEDKRWLGINVHIELSY
ncbi:MAG: hypothetical protein L0Y73_09055 [Candidatus Aminicenantes bacterium]|nr:hypothetical protein [Candidatus Aminicenantes bacterium]